MKFIIVTFIALIAVSVSSNTEVSLYRRNHLGYEGLDVLEKTKTSVLLNGVMIKQKSPVQLDKKMAPLLSFVKSSKKRCPSGFYIHTISTDGVKKEQRGCAQGPEYAAMIKSIKELKKEIKSQHAAK